MKATKTILFSVLIISLCLLIQAHDFDEEDNVIVLHDNSLEEAVSYFEHILVEFYAPWCGHCKKLAPEYARAAARLKKDNIYLAKIDASEEKEMAGKLGVQGFPTLAFFRNGEPEKYGGGRTENEIVNWLKKTTGPAAKQLTSVKEAEETIENNNIVVIYFGGESDRSELFYSIAQGQYSQEYAICGSSDCLSHYNVKEGSIVLFKKFDEKRNDFSGELSKDALLSFINTYSNPLILSFDEGTANAIFSQGQSGLFLFRDRNDQRAEELNVILTSVAHKLRGKIKIVQTGITEGMEVRLAEYMGMKPEHLPTVRLYNTGNGLKKYTMKGDITEGNILSFYDEWINNKLKAETKSEEIPTEQKEAVYVLVGKSFNDIVLDKSKDVMVELYAPWCGHCKALAPIYEELAQSLKENKNLIIAKMDATANEVEDVNIGGYPTILFYPAGENKQSLNYEGERTLEALKKYLKENCKNKLEEAGQTNQEL